MCAGRALIARTHARARNTVRLGGARACFICAFLRSDLARSRRNGLGDWGARANTLARYRHWLILLGWPTSCPLCAHHRWAALDAASGWVSRARARSVLAPPIVTLLIVSSEGVGACLCGYYARK